MIARVKLYLLAVHSIIICLRLLAVWLFGVFNVSATFWLDSHARIVFSGACIKKKIVISSFMLMEPTKAKSIHSEESDIESAHLMWRFLGEVLCA